MIPRQCVLPLSVEVWRSSGGKLCSNHSHIDWSWRVLPPASSVITHGI